MENKLIKIDIFDETGCWLTGDYFNIKVISKNILDEFDELASFTFQYDDNIYKVSKEYVGKEYVESWKREDYCQYTLEKQIDNDKWELCGFLIYKDYMFCSKTIYTYVYNECMYNSKFTPHIPDDGWDELLERTKDQRAATRKRVEMIS